jgi:hypothetical protein
MIQNACSSIVRAYAASSASEQCTNVTDVLTKELLTLRSNSYVGKRARRAEPISLGWQGIGGA